MWSIVKNIINRNKEKYINRRFKLSDGSITNDKKLIDNKFNDFFINVGPNLANRIERQNKNPEQFMKAKVTHSLYLEPVTEQEIHQLVSSLKKIISRIWQFECFNSSTRPLWDLPCPYIHM